MNNQSYQVVPNFSPQAEQMRAQYDSNVGPPYGRGGAPYQVWDYWHVPGMYTYLRTDPCRILGHALVTAFLDHLRGYARNQLGLTRVMYPYLSLYVNGCGQGLHNDSENGQFAYVYSLTHWNERSFVGGETLIFREGSYWHSGQFLRANAGTGFYAVVPSHFNQLVVFDDRLIHGVQTLQGTMNPLEGRVVLHGHLEAGSIDVHGGLTAQEVQAVMDEAFQPTHLLTTIQQNYHGYVSFGFTILPTGAVQEARVVSQRLLNLNGEEDGTVNELVAETVATLDHLCFRAMAGETQVIFPVVCAQRERTC